MNTFCLRYTIALALWAAAGVLAEERTACRIKLVDVTAESGITFQHHHGGSGQSYIVEGVASGLALFDYDGDGLIDIYFLNGAPLRGTTLEVRPQNTLYRNQGNWKFTDVTDEAGVGDVGYGLGVVAGDYDNDGDQDVYVNNFGPNVLYRNNGDRTFTDVTHQAGVGNGDKVGAGATFFDMEGDGDLDLYVANYVDFNFDNHVPIVVEGHRFKAGPQFYKPVPDTLYRNNGNGTFSDVSGPAGIAAVAGPSMATLSSDFDDDGDADVFVCNDGTPNFLFVNDGRGVFTEQALLAGVACDFYGKENSSMGVDCGDFNDDGLLDLFVTDYQSEMPVLYRSLGRGLFEDATSAAQISNALFAHVHWGTGFVDFDNDRDLDLFVACGHFDRIELLDDRTALKVPNFLLMNTGSGKFVDVSKLCGDGLDVVESSRGAAFDDLDNDGDVDVVILNSQSHPTILRNDSSTNQHWLQIQLVGELCSRDAVGARVRVVTADRVQTAAVLHGRGYQSHFGTRIHFGLGAETHIDRVEVTWPGGRNEIFDGLQADHIATLKQGTASP
jgi:hypothetical protein